MNASNQSNDLTRAALLAASANDAQSGVSQHFAAGRSKRTACMICSQHATCGGQSRVFSRNSVLPSALSE